jgi:hypothetical protein
MHSPISYYLKLIYEFYRLHPVVCIISYGYSRQHNREGISSMKTKMDVGIYLAYLI